MYIAGDSDSETERGVSLQLDVYCLVWKMLPILSAEHRQSLRINVFQKNFSGVIWQEHKLLYDSNINKYSKNLCCLNRLTQFEQINSWPFKG